MAKTKAEIATELWAAILANPSAPYSTLLVDHTLFEKVENLAERIYNRLS